MRRDNFKADAEIRLKGHAPVEIENTFAPGDTLNPDGNAGGAERMGIFTRLFTNQFEAVQVEKIYGAGESTPGRQSYAIESAWLEKGEAAPGETLGCGCWYVLIGERRGSKRPHSGAGSGGA